jgi:hypothetical protein
MLTFPKKKGLSWFKKHSPPPQQGELMGTVGVFFKLYFSKENQTCWAGFDVFSFFLKKTSL